MLFVVVVFAAALCCLLSSSSCCVVDYDVVVVVVFASCASVQDDSLSAQRSFGLLFLPLLKGTIRWPVMNHSPCSHDYQNNTQFHTRAINLLYHALANGCITFPSSVRYPLPSGIPWKLVTDV